MDEVVNVLCGLSKLHCKVLFGESERFEEWLKEKGIKNKVILDKCIFIIHLFFKNYKWHRYI